MWTYLDLPMGKIFILWLEKKFGSKYFCLLKTHLLQKQNVPQKIDASYFLLNIHIKKDVLIQLICELLKAVLS